MYIFHLLEDTGTFFLYYQEIPNESPAALYVCTIDESLIGYRRSLSIQPPPSQQRRCGQRCIFDEYTIRLCANVYWLHGKVRAESEYLIRGSDHKSQPTNSIGSLDRVCPARFYDSFFRRSCSKSQIPPDIFPCAPSDDSLKAKTVDRSSRHLMRLFQRTALFFLVLPFCSEDGGSEEGGRGVQKPTAPNINEGEGPLRSYLRPRERLSLSEILLWTLQPA